MEKLEDPAFWQSFALVNIIGWCLVAVAAEFTGWVNDPAYISRLSEVALILASLGWWQSSRVEVKQARDADVQEVLDEVRGNNEED